MIQILNLIGRFVLRIKDAFKNNIESFVGSFIISSLLLFVICHFIPKEDLPWHISEYILEIFLFMVVYPTMLLLMWCPTRKEKLKALSKVAYFFLHIILICSFAVLPPLFFSYLVLLVAGCSHLIKTVHFWIFVSTEIFVYVLMLGFKIDFEICLWWCFICEIYLLFWIYNAGYKTKKRKMVKKTTHPRKANK